MNFHNFILVSLYCPKKILDHKLLLVAQQLLVFILTFFLYWYCNKLWKFLAKIKSNLKCLYCKPWCCQSFIKWQYLFYLSMLSLGMTSLNESSECMFLYITDRNTMQPICFLHQRFGNILIYGSLQMSVGFRCTRFPQTIVLTAVFLLYK